MSAMTESPGIVRIARPAIVADNANMAPLYATRSGGRCPIRCVTVAPPAATKGAACHPKRTTVATAKTRPSVTPPASTPSTGTGKRSTSAIPKNSARIASSEPSECEVRAYVKHAAPVATTPATMTGATIARTLEDGAEAVLTAPLQGRGRFHGALCTSPLNLPVAVFYQPKLYGFQPKLPSSDASATRST